MALDVKRYNNDPLASFCHATLDSGELLRIAINYGPVTRLGMNLPWAPVEILVDILHSGGLRKGQDILRYDLRPDEQAARVAQLPLVRRSEGQVSPLDAMIDYLIDCRTLAEVKQRCDAFASPISAHSEDEGEDEDQGAHDANAHQGLAIDDERSSPGTPTGPNYGGPRARDPEGVARVLAALGKNKEAAEILEGLCQDGIRLPEEEWKNKHIEMSPPELELRARTLGNLASVYRSLGRLDEALACSRRAHIMFRWAENLDGFAVQMQIEGNILSVLEDFDNALNRFDRAAVVADKLGNEELLGTCLFRSGLILAKKHSDSDALSRVRFALLLYLRVGKRDYASDAKGVLSFMRETANVPRGDIYAALDAFFGTPPDIEQMTVTIVAHPIIAVPEFLANLASNNEEEQVGTLKRAVQENLNVARVIAGLIESRM